MEDLSFDRSYFVAVVGKTSYFGVAATFLLWPCTCQGSLMQVSVWNEAKINCEQEKNGF